MIGEKVEKYINMVQTFNHQVKFMCCNNAGKNKKRVGDVAKKHIIHMEFTSSDTSQMNEAVKCCIFTLKLKNIALLQQANLNNDARNKLWAETVRCANAVKKLLLTNSKPGIPSETFLGHKFKLY